MISVEFFKFGDKAVIPTKAHPSDAGFDMVATSKNITDDYIEYGTDIAIKLPEGHCALLFPRSSNSNKDLLLSNAVGVVDSHYIGELKWRFKRVPKTPKFSYKTLFGFVREVFTKPNTYKEYKVGDKIGQIVVIPLPEVQFVEVDHLDETDRGNGGFGSTDINTVEPTIAVESPKPTKSKKSSKKKTK